jgi:hypothetical protein
MAISEQERQVVQDFFDAMQAGPAGEQKMMSVFAEDAVMTEPFDGPQTHQGKSAIRERFIGIWSGDGPHDLSLTIDQIDLQGSSVQVEWSCTSAAFKSPMRGIDAFVIQDGLIKKLDMSVTAWPEMEGAHA